MSRLIFLLILIANVKSVEFETVNFNEALDFWIPTVETKPLLFHHLKTLLDKNKKLTRKDLIVKVGIWAKEHNLQNEFANFVNEKRRAHQKEVTNMIQNDEDTIDSQVSLLVNQLNLINNDLTLSFYDSCRKQNSLIRETNPIVLNRLGFTQLNVWCEEKNK